jgi:pimeloyl-ACP methyl ester carboxylesterase
MVRKLAVLVLLIAAAFAEAEAQLRPGENCLPIRGKAQEVYYLPAKTSPALGTILFSPGDGGWHGLAIDWAEKMASWGYDVYGIDTLHYLASLGGKQALRPEEVTNDYAELSSKLVAPNTPVVLVGWSEGASLSLLAALAQGAKPSPFRGLVVIGLPEDGILGWKWKDALTWVTKKTPDEPQFHASDYIPRLRIPFYILRSSQDQYVTAENSEHMLAVAAKPKRLVVVPSDNHRFSSNREGFLRELKNAIEWTRNPV